MAEGSVGIATCGRKGSEERHTCTILEHSSLMSLNVQHTLDLQCGFKNGCDSIFSLSSFHHWEHLSEGIHILC